MYRTKVMANITKTKKQRMHKHIRSIVPDNYKINIIRNISPAPYFRWKGVLDRVCGTSANSLLANYNCLGFVSTTNIARTWNILSMPVWKKRP